MDKKAIGFKVELNIAVFLLTILGGLALVAGGILFFLFVMQGAIGGGITGALVAVGGMLIYMAIYIKFAPLELVHIDAEFVYFRKTSIKIENINSVSSKGMTITITPKNGKRIQQSFVKNSIQCTEHIKNIIMPSKA